MADKSAGADGAKQSSQNQFGSMPEWDLSDLYPGTTSDEFKNDLSKAEKMLKLLKRGLRVAWRI